MSISSVLPKSPRSDNPSNAKPKKKTKSTAPAPISKKAANAATSTPTDAKAIKVQNDRVARANALRKSFPNMRNIPNSITPSQRKKLILLHTQKATSMLQPTPSATNGDPKDVAPAPTVQSTNKKKVSNDEKQRSRAALLKQQYPGMEGIPPEIGQGTKKKLVAQYKAKSSAVAPSVTMSTFGKAAPKGPRLNKLPARPVPPAPYSGTYPKRQSLRLNEAAADSLATSEPKSQRPTSYKMAPLSDERRAEVARNLASGSNNDPVMID